MIWGETRDWATLGIWGRKNQGFGRPCQINLQAETRWSPRSRPPIRPKNNLVTIPKSCFSLAAGCSISNSDGNGDGDGNGNGKGNGDNNDNDTDHTTTNNKK